MSAWEWKEYVPERPIEERLPYNSIDLLLTDEKPKTTAKDPVGTIKPHGKLQALILMIISNFILLVFRRIITRTILLCSQIVLHTGRGSLCVLANLMHSAPNGLQYFIAQIFLFAAMRMCPKKPCPTLTLTLPINTTLIYRATTSARSRPSEACYHSYIRAKASSTSCRLHFRGILVTFSHEAPLTHLD